MAIKGYLLYKLKSQGWSVIYKNKRGFLTIAQILRKVILINLKYKLFVPVFCVHFILYKLQYTIFFFPF